MFNRECICC